MLARRPSVRSVLAVAALLLLAASGCGPRDACTGADCGTLVIAAPGGIATLLPPLSGSSVERDIFDQVFLRLADLKPGAGTIGDSGYAPQLARAWEWSDPTTLVFHLDPRAHWQDGRPVTAADVQFTFEAYTDTAVGATDPTALRRIASVTATDSLTAVFRFRERYPEAFHDATFHMRVLPAHLLGQVPRREWRTAPFGRAPVGDGPYRFVSWVPDQSVELAADSTFFLGRPHLRRLVWRFTPDLSVAVTQVVAGEADAIEVLVSPPNVERAEGAGHLTLYPYAGGTYTFLRFNLRADGDRTRAHPLFGDPEVRRALVLATDRARMAQSVFAGRAKVPPGPMPQQWAWLWVPELTVPPYDTAEASRLLEARGWRTPAGSAIRTRGGRRLGFRVAVPSTSAGRRQYARLLQEQLRAVGVEVTIDEMDNAAMGEQLQAGRFDAAIESWMTDPTPSAGVPQIWGADGGSNYGGYANPAFERAVAAATTAATPAAARTAWVGAFEILAHDVPGIMLYAPDNVAAIDSRVGDVVLRPDSWMALVRDWRILPGRLTERDRAGR